MPNHLPGKDGWIRLGSLSQGMKLRKIIQIPWSPSTSRLNLTIAVKTSAVKDENLPQALFSLDLTDLSFQQNIYAYALEQRLAAQITKVQQKQPNSKQDAEKLIEEAEKFSLSSIKILQLVSALKDACSSKPQNSFAHLITYNQALSGRFPS